jgi:enamine deaminase RidA (YjgF/YER057c/UK114 family)
MEKPWMELVRHNPRDGVYAATPDYIHAMEVRNPRRLLFVSGTMGLDGTGKAADDLPGQLDLIWSNLRAILADAGLSVGNIVRLTSYLRDAEYAEANQNARLAALGDHIIPTTAIVVQTLRDDWLVEIEIIAAG